MFTRQLSDEKQHNSNRIRAIYRANTRSVLRLKIIIMKKRTKK